MFGQKEKETSAAASATKRGDSDTATAQRLLTVSGDYAKIEGTFEIADSLEVECEIGGELNVRGRLTIGQNGSVNANVRTVDAVIKGSYEGNMVATGNVEIAATGRVTGNITTDSLVISKGGFFNGNVTRIKEGDKKEGRMLVLDDETQAPADARPDPATAGAPAATAATATADSAASAPASPAAKEEQSERVLQGSRNV